MIVYRKGLLAPMPFRDSRAANGLRPILAVAILLTACAQPAAWLSPSPTLRVSPTEEPDAPTAAPSLEVVMSTYTPMPEPSEEQGYVVQDGDGLVQIAALFGVSMDAILEANDLADPDTIATGQELLIPAPVKILDGTIYVVQPGDSLTDIAAMYDLAVEDILAANDLADDDSIDPGQALVIPINLILEEGDCMLAATFVAGVTANDGAEPSAASALTVTWRIRNASTCDWEDGYELTFLSGSQMGGVNSVPVPSVQSGGIVSVSIDMIAPNSPNIYLSVWRLQTPDEASFGLRPYVRLTVSGATSAEEVTETGNSPMPGPDAEEVVLATPQSIAIPVSVISGITVRSRQIFLVGQATGMRPDTFSKVGDSITDFTEYLNPIGHGAYILDEYAYLEPVIRHFSTRFSTVRGWTGNSFTNDSAAAVGGWASGDILDPYHTDVFCGGGEAPLRCEYWLTKPAVALIMIGTNEPPENVYSGVYQQNLNGIVEMSIDLGVIPVLFTIPWRQDGDASLFNDVITRTAWAYDIPLVDYWTVMETLPNHGIGEDGIHPSAPSNGQTGDFTPEGLQYGYNVRNLLSLQVLDAIWRQAIY